ncbi:hypothetical protein EKO23_23235 [Nocardioides guangzhouensis]|uniref:DUF559 domain-containing protein n=1 Tax=Nocardioides guangzhouensis TaxID=2497878 RepID=A0A4Q4Z202_9ACTN|nr:DUF559 domain-containing protein [Nocardioides guangzhouensis]RYP81650.1 hypothetical protein EKO23_23235 [Nocardioides guangzhouensis]
MTFQVFGDLPFTTAMARAAGIDGARLSRAVAEQELARLLLGVYIRNDVERTPQLLARAASLVVGAGSVICDRTAAWIHGVECFDFQELDGVPPVESYVLRGRRATDRPQCGGGTRDLQPRDWMDIGGVRVTTPVRTALDLGCKLPRRKALAAMDALMRIHGFTRAELVAELPRYFRRRGSVQLRQLVPLVDGRSESTGESWSRLEISDRSLPAPVPQHWVHVAGVPTYRLDLAYAHARIAIEYDGEEFHTLPEDREADERRRAWLREHGWIVIVLTKDSFTEDAIIGWIGELRRALAVRQAA